jgi:hypothetical protein
MDVVVNGLVLGCIPTLHWSARAISIGPNSNAFLADTLLAGKELE